MFGCRYWYRCFFFLLPLMIWCSVLSTAGLVRETLPTPGSGNNSHEIEEELSRSLHTLDKLEVKQTLMSVYFPYLRYPERSNSKVHYVITIAYHGEYRAFIRLLFHDLDLPLSASLVIYDGKDLLSRRHQIQPNVRKGVWQRPSLQSTDRYLTLYYHLGSARSGVFAGFKATYWATRSRVWNEIPYTECPVIRPDSVMPGGAVRLESHSYRGLQFMYECIWLIKIPYHSLQVYVNYRLWNSKGCTLQIREGISSQANLVRNHSSVTGNVTMGIFGSITTAMATSRIGLFISFYGCPVWSTTKLSLTYGVFGLTPSLSSGKECWMRFNKQYGNRIIHNKIRGFVCQGYRVFGAFMCIPIKSKCDRINNCPDGSDEAFQHCSHLINSRFMCNKKCVDGSCEDSSSEECDECLPGEKMCPSGVCVDAGKPCPQGKCPKHYPLMCVNGHCYSHAEKCDGHDDCGDQTDERHCPQSTYTVTFGHWWYYLTIPAILVFTAASSVLCCRRRQGRHLHVSMYSNQTNIQVDNFTALMSRHHSQSMSQPPGGAHYPAGTLPPTYEDVVTSAPKYDETDAAGNDVLPPAYEDVCQITSSSTPNANMTQTETAINQTVSDTSGPSNRSPGHHTEEEPTSHHPLLRGEQVT